MILDPVTHTSEANLSEAQCLLTLYSEYTLTLMRERTGMEYPTRRPVGISLQAAGELETVVGQVYAAHKNVVCLDYSIADMRTSLQSKPDNVTQQDFLRQQFPSPFPKGPGGQAKLLEGPTMIVDTLEKPHVVLLARIIHQGSRKTCWDACRRLFGQFYGLASNTPRPIMLAGKVNWRTDKVYFKESSDCLVRPGVVNISPCWFPQGHLCSILSAPPGCIQPISQRARASLQPTLLKPPIQDLSGGPFMYDFLSTFGWYDEGRFEVPALGARFPYNLGTGIFLPGYIFNHGAARVEGERICLAGFIRPEVGRYTYRNTEDEGWVDKGPPCYQWLTYHWGYDISPELQTILEECRRGEKQAIA
ncbi:hypothetical protein FA13DRAFT_1705801 [Coprinellus micaceus]|uniref:Uncharacterized protein n=1 Tax=Coprinellus micaceus TaxID=71717 RepID=A0A4Y7TU19_COPMI|nr:hypothetical protein FA13DRAFT_1705801 [Coprinellus micaceus]